MADPEREAILQHDRARKALRQALRMDAQQAKHDLHPRTIGARWQAKQMARLAGAATSARRNVAKNAPLVGMAGLAILLFAARKPISQWMQRFRQRERDGKGVER